MPWPEKQRRAIFLDTQRRKGTAAAKALMHEAGYGGGTATKGTDGASKKAPKSMTGAMGTGTTAGKLRRKR